MFLPTISTNYVHYCSNDAIEKDFHVWTSLPSFDRYIIEWEKMKKIMQVFRGSRDVSEYFEEIQNVGNVEKSLWTFSKNVLRHLSPLQIELKPQIYVMKKGPPDYEG